MAPMVAVAAPLVGLATGIAMPRIELPFLTILGAPANVEGVDAPKLSSCFVIIERVASV